MAMDITQGCLVRLPWDYPPLNQLRASTVSSWSTPSAHRWPSPSSSNRSISGMATAQRRTRGLWSAGRTRIERCSTVATVGLRDGRPSASSCCRGRQREGMCAVPFLGLVHRGPVHLAELLLSTVLVGARPDELAQPWVIAAPSESIPPPRGSSTSISLSRGDGRALRQRTRAAAGTTSSYGRHFYVYRRRFRSDRGGGPQYRGGRYSRWCTEAPCWASSRGRAKAPSRTFRSVGFSGPALRTGCATFTVSGSPRTRATDFGCRLSVQRALDPSTSSRLHRASAMVRRCSPKAPCSTRRFASPPTPNDAP